MWGTHWICLGVAILLLITIDMLQSTLGYGNGPLVDRVSGALSRLMAYVGCRLDSRRVLASVGFIYIATSFLIWISLLWIGWLLVFCGSEMAVVEAATGQPADLASRVYFAGYTISTLGVGDYCPQGGVWQFTTALASLSGLVTVTFLLSMLVGMLQSTLLRRQTAIYIHHLGSTPTEIVVRSWDGTHCGSLKDHLLAFTTELTRLEQQHRYFPFLHRFYSYQPREDIGIALVSLSEALLLLAHGVKGEAAVCPKTVAATREAIHGFLSTSTFVVTSDDDVVPELPALRPLREAGLPTVAEEEFAQLAHDCAQHRRQMMRIVESEGWQWQVVHAGTTIGES